MLRRTRPAHARGPTVDADELGTTPKRIKGSGTHIRTSSTEAGRLARRLAQYSSISMYRWKFITVFRPYHSVDTAEGPFVNYFPVFGVEFNLISPRVVELKARQMVDDVIL
ncbi:hypothetical protein EVAR_22371_1 [Eumeta japonica]|uniref:Uncharacterized protein n=1 Tax=Eumeta variegata TaxID=151549 RepID=A0A4C1VJZ8_EUMVA|nr:hypothetical protein EVAR_22371_1 [Eumeta japonica]